MIAVRFLAFAVLASAFTASAYAQAPSSVTCQFESGPGGTQKAGQSYPVVVTVTGGPPNTSFSGSVTVDAGQGNTRTVTFNGTTDANGNYSEYQTATMPQIGYSTNSATNVRLYFFAQRDL